MMLPVQAAPKAQSVTLSTQDGWKLAAEYQPATTKETTVILLHDFGKKKEEFTSFERALVKMGFGYLAVDLRGHGQSTGNGEYKKFAREGADNPFNQMVQDGQTAVSFLRSKGISLDQIILLGTGLGANVAAKTAQLVPDVNGIALISPNVNIRDVLPVPALRTYKGAVLIAASAGDRKGFLEASILRNVAFLTAGEGNVTFLTAYDFTGHELLDKYITQSVVQWIGTPRKPESAPDVKAASLQPHTGVQRSQTASQTEQALVPSVLLD
ncbi:MAG: alpha/beta fold hydrolase [Elusimicrobiaceae bacterium]|nr:alpha/beta fold hydrolase [Elusimicrobiaceae bacterium]